ncbi:hypothetical protein LTR37_005064 [Vermiconidia calcicola]|uniref:Uncharacterized protein n=1 Tax=Vermiconidia calcicola TaxID=1690605 RepID=A0ACC3NKB8_9PEZI|nr:hypothetical protein LTR37_005064 [Vermiconidia calcicola]
MHQRKPSDRKCAEPPSARDLAEPEVDPRLSDATQGFNTNADEASGSPRFESVATGGKKFSDSTYYTSRDFDNAEICDTRRFCNSPESSISGESMNNHGNNRTPPDSPPKAESPGSTTIGRVERLSLENDRSGSLSQTRRGRGMLSAMPCPSSKRAASSELQRTPGKGPPGAQPYRDASAGAHRHVKLNARHARGNAGLTKPLPRDSGYVSFPSRESTLNQTHNRVHAGQRSYARLPAKVENSRAPHQRGNSTVLGSQARYPDLILQPESSPISEEQLAAEVKGIYAGLVMVEAKCINIDAAQAADPKSQLGAEQWQALIALHRTLLYEHHDFLMATQHPSATSGLQGLATKYSMPARMWKHGIHAFLEVLRHRRPDSQDYMLAFIYLAYQMMALLFETVPTFIDTWIECLGDLARYRMAIDEEKEAHAIWGGVAAQWYHKASDRHAGTGRLNHHLGILERPSLRKFCLYAKALTSVIPFPNARDSLATLCGPVAQGEQANHSAETCIMAFHAQLYLMYENEMVSNAASESLSRLSQQPTAKLGDWGVSLVIINIAAVLEYGSSNSHLWQLFGNALSDIIQSTRPSIAASESPDLGLRTSNDLPLFGTSPSSSVLEFSYRFLSIIIRLENGHQLVRDTLPSVHAMLVWQHSLYTLRSRTKDRPPVDTISSLMSPTRFNWVGLCSYLNMIGQHAPITTRTIECAHRGSFLLPDKNGEASRPLQEDYLLRGLIWTQFYYPANWFDTSVDVESRTIETPGSERARVERVQWLGVYLALRIDHLRFDVHTKMFHAPVDTPTAHAPPSEPARITTQQDQRDDVLTPASRSSATLSAHSDSDDYAVITSRTSKPDRTYASVASKTSKVRPDYSAVKVFDDESMRWDD